MIAHVFHSLIAVATQRSTQVRPHLLRLYSLFVAALLTTTSQVSHAQSSPESGPPNATPPTVAVGTSSAMIGNYRYAERPEVKTFMDDLVKQGFARNELVNWFDKVRYSEAVVKAVMPAPVDRPKNWKEYRNRFIEPTRIKAGLQYWKDNAATLKRAAEQYGVPEEYIVAIIGIETIYGKNMGSFRIMDALTTLAFDYPDVPNKRNALFLSELEAYLKWTRSRGIDPFSILGSYAGAIGIGQFMPSSIVKYAVDFDDNTFIDLRTSHADAIGSVANFLNAHGWQRGRPIIWRLADDDASLGIAQAGADGKPEPQRPLDDYLKAGLQLSSSESGLIRDNERDTKVLVVDLPSPDSATQYVLGIQNFYVLTRYNRSFFYAMAVHDLAETLRNENLLARGESAIRNSKRDNKAEDRADTRMEVTTEFVAPPTSATNLDTAIPTSATTDANLDTAAAMRAKGVNGGSTAVPANQAGKKSPPTTGQSPSTGKAKPLVNRKSGTKTAGKTASKSSTKGAVKSSTKHAK